MTREDWIAVKFAVGAWILALLLIAGIKLLEGM